MNSEPLKKSLYNPHIVSMIWRKLLDRSNARTVCDNCLAPNREQPDCRWLRQQRRDKRNMMMMLISDEKTSQPPDISLAIENNTLDDAGSSNETNTLSSVYVKVSSCFWIFLIFFGFSWGGLTVAEQHQEDFNFNSKNLLHILVCCIRLRNIMPSVCQRYWPTTNTTTRTWQSSLIDGKLQVARFSKVRQPDKICPIAWLLHKSRSSTFKVFKIQTVFKELKRFKMILQTL